MTFVMMVGLPGSGKTFQANQLKEEYGAVLLNSDDLRARFGVSKDDQTVTKQVFEYMASETKRLVESGKNVIYDATNISAKRRHTLISSLNCRKICCLVMRSYENCRKALKGRDHFVPEYALERMYKSFDTPYYCEGWDEIRVIYTDGDGERIDPEGFANQFLDYDQHNPYHNETLGEHLVRTSERLKETGNCDLIMAGYLHDIGKPFCKTFFNMKGEKSENAHYYGHESVGAYEVMFFNLDGLDKLHISWLVSNHMLPHSWERNDSVKSIRKCRRQWGEKLYSEIVLLGKADDESKTA